MYPFSGLNPMLHFTVVHNISADSPLLSSGSYSSMAEMDLLICCGQQQNTMQDSSWKKDTLYHTRENLGIIECMYVCMYVL